MKDIKTRENRMGDDGKPMFMFNERYCPKCRKWIKGFQFIPTAYDCTETRDFRCPICDKSYLQSHT